jgi:PAS domain S-box-containing protein
MIQRRLPSDRAAASQADALEVEQTKLLYAGLPAAIVINALLALILVGAQSAVISPIRLYGWLALIGAVLLARSGLALAWRHGGADVTKHALRWRRRFRIGVITTGIAWGIGAALLFPHGDELHQLVLAYVLAGLSAGAITALAVDRVSTIGFLVPTLLPLIAQFAMKNSMVSYSMSAMALLFLFFITLFAARAGRSLHENFQLRIQAMEQAEALRQSEAQLNQSQRSARIGYWELDLTTNQVYWSDEVYRIFEIDQAGFGASYEAFLNAVHPDDRGWVNKAYRDTLVNHEPYDIVHRLLFADGRTKYVQERCETLFDSGGNAVRSLGTVQDVTELERAEERQRKGEKKYRLLFENSRDALMTLAPPSWKFTSANRSTLQLFGVPSEAEFAKLTPWDISPERQHEGRSSFEKAHEMIETALQEGSHFFEWTHKRLDGTPFPTEVLLSRVADDDQINLQATVRDITERRRLEREILERRNEMDELQKSQVMAQTVAAIAHELNQPLSAVASYSETALMLINSEHPDMVKIRETIELSEQQALRAGKSIRDLFEYLSVQDFPREAFDLNQEIVHILDTAKSEHELQFNSVLHLEKHLPMVQANRTHIRKALLNLVHNGIEAMRIAKVPLPAITVTVRTIKEKKVAQVTVQDNGPGIKHEDIQRLFEPFFTTKTGGIGMGLAISRSLVEMNGGQLWIDPDAEPGATFHLTLPFAS